MKQYPLLNMPGMKSVKYTYGEWIRANWLLIFGPPVGLLLLTITLTVLFKFKALAWFGTTLVTTGFPIWGLTLLVGAVLTGIVFGVLFHIITAMRYGCGKLEAMTEEEIADQQVFIYYSNNKDSVTQQTIFESMAIHLSQKATADLHDHFNTHEPHPRQFLFELCESGDTKLIESLWRTSHLSWQIDLLTADNSRLGLSALAIAAHFGQLRTLRHLVNCWGEILPKHADSTPIFHKQLKNALLEAMKNNNMECMKFIMDTCINIAKPMEVEDFKDTEADHPLDKAQNDKSGGVLISEELVGFEDPSADHPLHKALYYKIGGVLSSEVGEAPLIYVFAKAYVEVVISYDFNPEAFTQHLSLYLETKRDLELFVEGAKFYLNKTMFKDNTKIADAIMNPLKNMDPVHNQQSRSACLHG